MQIKFTKMHGLGNDFVVIDAINQSITLSLEQIKFLAQRNFAIGCDQVLLVEASDIDGVDFRYRIFNADGGEVEQCGNGARCFARFVNEQQLTNKKDIRVQTLSGIITLQIKDDGNVLVDMGQPRFSPEEIPYDGNCSKDQAGQYHLSSDNKEFFFYSASMGNPHAVLNIANLPDEYRFSGDFFSEQKSIAVLGQLFMQHRFFPQRVNVGFMQIIDKENILLRVYERGVGETLACGTGACAAVACGIYNNLLANQVKVTLAGGEVSISWSGKPADSLLMSGPALSVFHGEIIL